ncbi:hypothetical protein AUTU_33110 [Aureibacter tunicatorum]|nr:hypothetical protein AUTU_33110 [Aureibacter tunicatorum]
MDPFLLEHGKMVQLSSYDTTGGNNDRINIHEGKTVEIANIDGPGVIKRMWFTTDSRDPYYLRRILLRFYWDDETEPSVEVPFGDFFGCGFEYKHHMAEYVGMSSGGYYSYFPMPFNKNARIEVVNQTGEEIFAFYYHINYFELDEKLPDDTEYFHAQWKRDIRTDYDDNFVALDAEGKGKFVGLSFNGEPYDNSLFYLEGDEMIYVDGEDFPSTYGTGWEDYFTGGWYFQEGPFDGPYHGVVVLDKENGRVTAYRHHIPDPIPFKESIKVTMEHGHANEQKVDWSTTVFWYQQEPHKPMEPIKKASLRIPLRRKVPNEAVDFFAYKLEGAAHKVVDMSNYGPDWFNMQQIEVDGGNGAEFHVTIPEAYEKAYNIDLYTTKGPDYGNVEIYHKGKKIGAFNGYHDEVFPAEIVSLEKLVPENQEIKLTFKVVGAHPKSKGFKMGLDAAVFEPERVYIPEWYMIGPFPNPRDNDYLRYGLDKVYEPEKEFDLSKTYVGIDDQELSWFKVDGRPGGYAMELWKLFDPTDFIITYAVTHVYSPEDQELPLLFSCDDGGKVFLNDDEIFRFLDVNIAKPDQHEINLKLKKGWNKLMVKAENNFGGFCFYARIIDKKGNLKYSVDK